MTDIRAWAIRPKWHRLESPRSYARRQCQAAGIPFEDVERGLTSPSQPLIYRVWTNEAAAAATIEAAAGRPKGHYLRLRAIAQPDPSLTYPRRLLCRLCSAGDLVEQIPHDRENWCLRHPGQMVWVGPGTTLETQLVAARSDRQAKAERRFRRLGAEGRIDPRLHARVWEMVRDNAWLTRPAGWKPELVPFVADHEAHGRAALFPETVRVLELLSNSALINQWVDLSSTQLRSAIASSLSFGQAPINVLVERIVLWLRPLRREVRPTRIDPLDVPVDIVDTPAIIDVTAPYPLWIQRRPQAVAEWNYYRNDPSRDPWEPRGTSFKAWWTCDAGHTWESTPYVRAVVRCPSCSGQAVWPGQTDLATQHPTVAAEWDRTPGANAGDPDHVGARSNRRVNWVCGEGHRWTATINNRTRNGSGCPFCVGNRVVPGQTDLASVRPDLAAEWDVLRNGELTPNVVGAFSTTKVWWTGWCGHSWDAAINNRSSGQGCPMCAGKRAIFGVTDLATVRPDLAAQWHSSNELRPTEVVPGSGKKVTWQCARGHLGRSDLQQARQWPRMPVLLGEIRHRRRDGSRHFAARPRQRMGRLERAKSARGVGGFESPCDVEMHAGTSLGCGDLQSNRSPCQRLSSLLRASRSAGSDGSRNLAARPCRGMGSEQSQLPRSAEADLDEVSQLAMPGRTRLGGNSGKPIERRRLPPV